MKITKPERRKIRRVLKRLRKDNSCFSFSTYGVSNMPERHIRAYYKAFNKECSGWHGRWTNEAIIWGEYDL